ncbi:MAG: MFS transporter, partial [Betaproteobacteria bacterium]
MKTSITRLSFFYFWYFAFIGAFAPFFSLYLHRCGYQPFEIAFLLGISPLLRVVIPFFWAWAADRFSSRDTLIKYLSLISPVCLAAIFFKPGFVLT